MKTVFLNELEKEYSELRETGKIQLVEDVKKLTSKEFSYKNPHYFLGNIRSRVVLITFNSNREYLCKENKLSGFNFNQANSQNLGEIFLESNDEQDLEAKYATDIRMLNYLKPYNLIRYNNNSIQQNLYKVANEKLELHLVPYLSPDFSEKDFMKNYGVCSQFIDRVMAGILTYPRQYVIFFGDCFKRILEEYIVESETFKFLLTSPNRPNQKFLTHFTRITIEYNNQRVIAGIAESFCDENLDEIMLEKYGQESVAIINRGFILSNPLWK